MLSNFIYFLVCICHELGTGPMKRDSCDKVSGQCKCLPNVDGLQCDQCKIGYYGLTSGKGCKECLCDKEGSVVSSKCNQVCIIYSELTD